MIQKYGAALISIALAAFAFLKIALSDTLDAAEVWQLVALVAGSALTFLLPLLSGKWAAGLKVGASLVAAAATAIVPFALQQTITAEQWTVVVLAVLSALGVQVGVDARVSSRAQYVAADLHGDPLAVAALLVSEANRREGFPRK